MHVASANLAVEDKALRALAVVRGAFEVCGVTLSGFEEVLKPLNGFYRQHETMHDKATYVSCHSKRCRRCHHEHCAFEMHYGDGSFLSGPLVEGADKGQTRERYGERREKRREVR